MTGKADPTISCSHLMVELRVLASWKIDLKTFGRRRLSSVIVIIYYFLKLNNNIYTYMIDIHLYNTTHFEDQNIGQIKLSHTNCLPISLYSIPIACDTLQQKVPLHNSYKLLKSYQYHSDRKKQPLQ